MKKALAVILSAIIFSVVNVRIGFSEDDTIKQPPMVKEVDVNNDDNPDVSYYHSGQYVTRIEADTNYDDDPDIIVNIKDGEFESAEVDTDYNGSMDKKFTSKDDFNNWVNENRPDFIDTLNRPDWQVKLLNF